MKRLNRVRRVPRSPVAFLVLAAIAALVPESPGAARTEDRGRKRSGADEPREPLEP
jgi:hypothetical protein